MFKKIVLAAIACAGIGAASMMTACGGGSISCSDACSCAGDTSDSCVSDCQAQLDAAQKLVDAAGCDSEYSDAQSCQADNATCDSSKKQYVLSSADACKTETDALNKCVAGGTGTGGTGGTK